MADFLPFRGIRYNPAVAGPLEALVCPPYDVISEAQERELLERSPHNMVRLELAERPEPLPAERYTAAAAHYRQWLSQDLLQRDQEPGFYLLRQRFPHAGGGAERYTLLGALGLEQPGRGVLPHEETAESPKQDRLALMQACAANFSPIMALYQDHSHQVETVRNRTVSRAPEAELEDGAGQQYTLWRITEPGPVRMVREALASQPVYLADGHHRYETALTYQELARRSGDSGGPEQALDFVMAGLIAFDDPSLLVLPYHRVVRGTAPELFTALRERMRELFTVQLAGVDTRTPGPLEALVAQEGASHPAMGLVGPGGEGPYLLTLREPAVAHRHAAQGPASAVRQVEAWLLQETLLRPVLGEGFEDYVTYVHDGQEALEMVASGQGQLAFFLKGIPPALFQQVVGTGIRLPRKSTYFHPKLPSGVVINPLEGKL